MTHPIIYYKKFINLCKSIKDNLVFIDVHIAILDILKIKDLKTTNRDHKKANKQDIRYYSIDSNGQDNIQLPL